MNLWYRGFLGQNNYVKDNEMQDAPPKTLKPCMFPIIWVDT